MSTVSERQCPTHASHWQQAGVTGASADFLPLCPSGHWLGGGVSKSRWGQTSRVAIGLTGGPGGPGGPFGPSRPRGPCKRKGKIKGRQVLNSGRNPSPPLSVPYASLALTPPRTPVGDSGLPASQQRGPDSPGACCAASLHPTLVLGTRGMCLELVGTQRGHHGAPSGKGGFSS